MPKKSLLFSSLFFLSFISLPSPGFSQEIMDLRYDEKKVYSQNGEDGVLQKIFGLIPPRSYYCVEFGAADGISDSNTHLLRKQGWNYLLLDSRHEKPDAHFYREVITAENINELFGKYHVPYDLDLLSIDIDYNDFYVWQALNEKYRPAVVVVEYNASHLPHEDKIVKYDPHGSWDGSNYYGASILSLYRLGRSKGYSLIYADASGANLFFIRDDLLEGRDFKFKNINQVEKIYRYPSYSCGPNGGHAQDLRNRPFVCSTDLQ